MRVWLENRGVDREEVWRFLKRNEKDLVTQEEGQSRRQGSFYINSIAEDIYGTSGSPASQPQGGEIYTYRRGSPGLRREPEKDGDYWCMLPLARCIWANSIQAVR